MGVKRHLQNPILSTQGWNVLEGFEQNMLILRQGDCLASTNCYVSFLIPLSHGSSAKDPSQRSG